jgi:hypothetical protein
VLDLRATEDRRRGRHRIVPRVDPGRWGHSVRSGCGRRSRYREEAAGSIGPRPARTALQRRSGDLVTGGGPRPLRGEGRLCHRLPQRRIRTASDRAVGLRRSSTPREAESGRPRTQDGVHAAARRLPSLRTVCGRVPRGSDLVATTSPARVADQSTGTKPQRRTSTSNACDVVSAGSRPGPPTVIRPA